MIKFQNKIFKSRLIDLPEFGEVLISVNTLNNLLMTDLGEYTSIEASEIDNEIFYFVDDDQIDLPDDQLLMLLTSEIL